jgi:hypothetical protein
VPLATNIPKTAGLFLGFLHLSPKLKEHLNSLFFLISLIKFLIQFNEETVKKAYTRVESMEELGEMMIVQIYIAC